MLEAIRIATRGSNLALWQARYVERSLKSVAGGRAVELVTVVSTGDAIGDLPLREFGGLGVFTKEVQEAVLAETADVAVHSLKDLPTQTHPELVLAAVPPRGPAGDGLIAPRFKTLDGLPEGATVATSSLRRRAQLLRHRPDLKLVDIRGNVETRLRKMVEQGLDGLVLAVAGLERLGLTEQITEYFAAERIVPAVGQGALGIECRRSDEGLREMLSQLDHLPSRQAVLAERAFLRVLEGGCQVPIGAYATVQGETLRLRGILLAEDGSQSFEGTKEGLADQPESIGALLAEELLSEGAGVLLG